MKLGIGLQVKALPIAVLGSDKESHFAPCMGLLIVLIIRVLAPRDLQRVILYSWLCGGGRLLSRQYTCELLLDVLCVGEAN